jgi:hypothetical protein
MSSEMVHVGQCTTAHAMWQNLEAIHKLKGHQTIIAIIQNLFCTVANEEMNVTEHLNTLKVYWEHINVVGDDDFKISNLFFKVIISLSLPYVWDMFTEPFVSGWKGDADCDPKKGISSQEFIGLMS